MHQLAVRLARVMAAMSALLAARIAVAQRAETLPATGDPVVSEPRTPTIFTPAIEAAQLRTAKVYGAAVGRDKGYGSGVVVSADGKVMTALTALLEGEKLRVVFADGRRAEARVVARDERRQLALLKTDMTDVPYFELGSSADVRVGDWVVAATNCFKIADGDEPITTAVGIVSGRARLEARRRTRDVSYDGPVIFTDVVVSSPGSAGGALVDLRGQLVGLIGRPVISNYTNTWANYALPVEELAAFVAAAESGAPVAKAGGDSAPPTKTGDGDRPPVGATRPEPAARPDLGIQLFSVGGRTKPAYVERVRKDSPAAQAGVRANDLILSINGKPVSTCEQYDVQLALLKPGDAGELVVKRGEQIMTLKLTVGSKP